MSDENQPILVVDVGSSSVKTGYSGEDVPSYVFPSSTAKHSSKIVESIEQVPVVDDGTGGQYYNSSNTAGPVQRGIVKDWDQMEKLWYTISDHSNLESPESTSIFLVESSLSTVADRTKWAEMMFETFRVPSICFGNSASLSIFASGRTTGVAVECGAGLTTAVPIFEGLALKHAAVYTEFGGQDISFNLKKLFNERDISIDLNSAKIIKERLAHVEGYSKPNAADMGGDSNSAVASFSLPDGTDVAVETDMLSSCTEQMFYNESAVSGGLIGQVHESIALCDDSVRRELANNIILSGGASMLPGLGDRLDAELKVKFEAEEGTKVHPVFPYLRVVPTTKYRERGYTTQRKHAAWIGGSLMGSFETYNKSLKITRQEWEENPDVMINTRSV